MIKNILFTFFFLSLISCKNTTSTDTISANKEEVIEISRPIPIEQFETLNDSLKLYYSKLNNHEIWFNKKNRQDLISEIKNSYKEGLNPDDYNLKKIEPLEKKRDSLKDNDAFEYDILLTTTFEKLALHLYKGKLNPKKLYNDWDLKTKTIALSSYLEKGITSKTLDKTFNEIKPQHFIYNQIKKSLLVLDKYPKYDFKKNKIDTKIEFHDTIDEIITIKHKLTYWKDYTRKDSITTPIYDTITFIAVKKFQARNGLKADGVIGNGTIKALNFSKEERKEQIIANLERWKWFPKDFGENYLITNLPDYQIAYVSKNDTIAKHNIVVGTPKRKTPVLTSKLSNLVFNPTWTVPPTIIKEDLTPSAKKNITYFERTRMTIYDSTGSKVTPEEWDSERARSYRYVQNSGYNNSLGLVKFNFPNRHLVYLHDTNHRDYFSREYRALSSGCVRIENPLDLSEKILNNEKKKLTKTDIDTIIKRKNIKTVPIQNEINVYFLYWTNWLDKDGLQFREDIYNLDKKLYRSLRS
jgi:murein L,D-transpeptidase YcbB/YkuD